MMASTDLAAPITLQRRDGYWRHQWYSGEQKRRWIWIGPFPAPFLLARVPLMTPITDAGYGSVHLNGSQIPRTQGFPLKTWMKSSRSVSTRIAGAEVTNQEALLVTSQARSRSNQQC